MQEAYIAVQIDKELSESDLERASMQREDYPARLTRIESRRCPGIAFAVIAVFSTAHLIFCSCSEGDGQCSSSTLHC